MLQQKEYLVHSPASLEYVPFQITTNISMWLVSKVIRYLNRLPHIEKQLAQWYTWWLKVTFFASFY